MNGEFTKNCRECEGFQDNLLHLRNSNLTNGIVPAGDPAYYMQQRRAGKDPVFRRAMMPEDEADIECWE